MIARSAGDGGEMPFAPGSGPETLDSLIWDALACDPQAVSQAAESDVTFQVTSTLRSAYAQDDGGGRVNDAVTHAIELIVAGHVLPGRQRLDRWVWIGPGAASATARAAEDRLLRCLDGQALQRTCAELRRLGHERAAARLEGAR